MYVECDMMKRWLMWPQTTLKMLHAHVHVQQKLYNYPHTVTQQAQNKSHWTGQQENDATNH